MYCRLGGVGRCPCAARKIPSRLILVLPDDLICGGIDLDHSRIGYLIETMNPVIEWQVSHTWPCAARAAEIGSSARISRNSENLFSARWARILPAQLRLLGPSNVLVLGETRRRGARCGSRSWQRVPWEVIS